LRDEKNPFDYHFYFEGGIKSYLKYLVKNDDVIHPNPFYGIGEKEDILVEAAFTYIDDYEIYEESFVNNIFTSEGGMHLTGFRAALTRVINDYARKQGFLKETEPNLTGDDIREGLTAVVSIKIKEPQFEGQTKSKLGNPEARTATETVVAEALTDYLEKFPQDAKIIVEKAVLSYKARKAAKAAKETVLRKGVLDGLSLPGKLSDCTSKNQKNQSFSLLRENQLAVPADKPEIENFRLFFLLEEKS